MQNDVLANTGKRERIQLAMKGENIEEIVAYDEPDVLVTLIDNGYAKEYYEQWKTHEHGTIRYALALQGYYPETFIHDKNPKVREAVVEVNPEYVKQLLAYNKKRHWIFVRDQICSNTKLKYIKIFLDTKVPHDVDTRRLEAIRTFYVTKTQTPTVLEQTMTPKQLFKMGSPFWAQGLMISRIESIQSRYAAATPHYVEEFFDSFDAMLDP